MAGITTAAILGSAAIAGGTSIAAGALASRAAGKAADTQSESADKALALQERMYQQERADTAPWRQQGGQAVQTLGALMGLPSGPVGGEPEGLTNQATLGGFVNAAQALSPRRSLLKSDYQDLIAAQQPPPPMNPAMVGAAPQGQPPQQNASSYALMRSPDGKETQHVPMEQVEHYQRMGARRVG